MRVDLVLIMLMGVSMSSMRMLGGSAEGGFSDTSGCDAQAGDGDPCPTLARRKLFHPAIHPKAEEQHELCARNRLSSAGTGVHRVRIAAGRRETNDIEVRPAQCPREIEERKETGDDERAWIARRLLLTAAGADERGDDADQDEIKRATSPTSRCGPFASDEPSDEI